MNSCFYGNRHVHLQIGNFPFTRTSFLVQKNLKKSFAKFLLHSQIIDPAIKFEEGILESWQTAARLVESMFDPLYFYQFNSLTSFGLCKQADT